jgi:hypothetical protein
MTIASVTGGDIIDPAWGNSVADSLNASVEAPWTSFTATWSGLTLGNATQDAAYRYTPGRLQFRGYLTFGSTTAITTGGVKITLPDSATVSLAAFAPYQPLGQATLRDNGSNTILGSIQYASSTQVAVQAWKISGSYIVTGNITASVPMTWIAGDSILFDVSVPQS